MCIRIFPSFDRGEENSYCSSAGAESSATEVLDRGRGKKLLIGLLGINATYPRGGLVLRTVDQASRYASQSKLQKHCAIMRQTSYNNRVPQSCIYYLQGARGSTIVYRAFGPFTYLNATTSRKPILSSLWTFYSKVTVRFRCSLESLGEEI